MGQPLGSLRKEVTAVAFRKVGAIAARAVGCHVAIAAPIPPFVPQAYSPHRFALAGEILQLPPSLRGFALPLARAARPPAAIAD